MEAVSNGSCSAEDLTASTVGKQEPGDGGGTGSGERAGTVPWEQRSTGHGPGMPLARCKADGTVSTTLSVPTLCQVFVGVDGRDPRPLGRDPANQSLASLWATVLEGKERWQS